MGAGITKLSVAGFKSIAKETALDIKPLTLLAGANSSGKSSFMQPLLLLKQTLDAPYLPAPLLLSGPNVNFTSFDQMLTCQKGKSTIREFVVTLESSQNRQTFAIPTRQIELHENTIWIIKRMIHVSGLRGSPARIYPTASVGPTFPGKFENYTASMISHWEEKSRIS